MKEGLIVLCLSEQMHAATYKRSRGGGFECRALPSRVVGEAGLGEALQATLLAAGGRREVCLMLPREAVMVRRLELPLAPDDDLPDLVKFQASTRFSAPVESLAIDFLPLPLGPNALQRQAMVYAIERKRLDPLVADVATANGAATHCLMTAPAAAELCLRLGARRGRMAPSFLAVIERTNDIEFVVVHLGHVVLTHSIHLANDEELAVAWPEISRLLVSLQQQQPDAELGAVWLVAEGSRSTALAEWLKQRFALEVQQVTAADTQQVSPLLWGAAAALSAPLAVHVDLLVPRERPPRSTLGRIRALAGGVAAALLLAVWGGMYRGWLADKDDAIERLIVQRRDLDDTLTAGEPALASYRLLEQWMLTRPVTTDLLAELEPQLPGADHVYFQSLQVGVDAPGAVHIRGVGVAKTRDDAERLAQRLAENGYRVKPQSLGGVSRDPAYAVSFPVDMEQKLPPLKW